MNINGLSQDPTHEREEHDFYATPPVFVKALLRHVGFNHRVWEPACGDGSITKVLEEAGYDVRSTDINPRGQFGKADFLECGEDQRDIVTNPAFSILIPFTLHAIAVSLRHVALVYPLYGLGGEKKFNRIWKVHPPKLILVNPARLVINGEHSQFNHTWVVWDKHYYGPTQTVWMDPVK